MVHETGCTERLALGWGWGRGWGGLIRGHPQLTLLLQLPQGAQRERPHLVRPQPGAELEQSQPVRASRQIPDTEWGQIAGHMYGCRWDRGQILS